MDRISEVWPKLLQGAALIVAGVLLFVVTPPRLSPIDDGMTWVRLSEFVGAILIVLVLATAHLGRWTARRLLFAAAATLVLSIAAFFGYRIAVAAWTCSSYDGRGPIVIGSDMLPDAAAYARTSGLDVCAIIQDSAGRTDTIWPASELFARHLTMAGLFVLSVLLFTLAAVLAVELWSVVARRRRDDP